MIAMFLDATTPAAADINDEEGERKQMDVEEGRKEEEKKKKEQPQSQPQQQQQQLSLVEFAKVCGLHPSVLHTSAASPCTAVTKESIEEVVLATLASWWLQHSAQVLDLHFLVFWLEKRYYFLSGKRSTKTIKGVYCSDIAYKIGAWYPAFAAYEKAAAKARTAEAMSNNSAHKASAKGESLKEKEKEEEDTTTTKKKKPGRLWGSNQLKQQQASTPSSNAAAATQSLLLREKFPSLAMLVQKASLGAKQTDQDPILVEKLRSGVDDVFLQKLLSLPLLHSFSHVAGYFQFFGKSEAAFRSLLSRAMYNKDDCGGCPIQKAPPTVNVQAIVALATTWIMSQQDEEEEGEKGSCCCWWDSNDELKNLFLEFLTAIQAEPFKVNLSKTLYPKALIFQSSGNDGCTALPPGSYKKLEATGVLLQPQTSSKTAATSAGKGTRHQDATACEQAATTNISSTDDETSRQHVALTKYGMFSKEIGDKVMQLSNFMQSLLAARDGTSATATTTTAATTTTNDGDGKVVEDQPQQDQTSLQQLIVDKSSQKQWIMPILHRVFFGGGGNDDELFPTVAQLAASESCSLATFTSLLDAQPPKMWKFEATLLGNNNAVSSSTAAAAAAAESAKDNPEELCKQMLHSFGDAIQQRHDHNNNNKKNLMHLAPRSFFILSRLWSLCGDYEGVKAPEVQAQRLELLTYCIQLCLSNNSLLHSPEKSARMEYAVEAKASYDTLRSVLTKMGGAANKAVLEGPLMGGLASPASTGHPFVLVLLDAYVSLFPKKTKTAPEAIQSVLRAVLHKEPLIPPGGPPLTLFLAGEKQPVGETSIANALLAKATSHSWVNTFGANAMNQKLFELREERVSLMAQAIVEARTGPAPQQEQLHPFVFASLQELLSHLTFKIDSVRSVPAVVWEALSLQMVNLDGVFAFLQTMAGYDINGGKFFSFEGDRIEQEKEDAIETEKKRVEEAREAEAEARKAKEEGGGESSKGLPPFVPFAPSKSALGGKGFAAENSILTTTPEKEPVFSIIQSQKQEKLLQNIVFGRMVDRIVEIMEKQLRAASTSSPSPFVQGVLTFASPRIPYYVESGLKPFVSRFATSAETAKRFQDACRRFAFVAYLYSDFHDHGLFPYAVLPGDIGNNNGKFSDVYDLHLSIALDLMDCCHVCSPAVSLLARTTLAESFRDHARKGKKAVAARVAAERKKNLLQQEQQKATAALGINIDGENDGEAQEVEKTAAATGDGTTGDLIYYDEMYEEDEEEEESDGEGTSDDEDEDENKPRGRLAGRKSKKGKGDSEDGSGTSSDDDDDDNRDRSSDDEDEDARLDGGEDALDGLSRAELSFLLSTALSTEIADWTTKLLREMKKNTLLSASSNNPPASAAVLSPPAATAMDEATSSSHPHHPENENDVPFPPQLQRTKRILEVYLWDLLLLQPGHHIGSSKHPRALLHVLSNFSGDNVSVMEMDLLLCSGVWGMKSARKASTKEFFNCHPVMPPPPPAKKGLSLVAPDGTSSSSSLPGGYGTPVSPHTAPKYTPTLRYRMLLAVTVEQWIYQTNNLDLISLLCSIVASFATPAYAAAVTAQVSEQERKEIAERGILLGKQYPAASLSKHMRELIELDGEKKGPSPSGEGREEEQEDEMENNGEQSGGYSFDGAAFFTEIAARLRAGLIVLMQQLCTVHSKSGYSALRSAVFRLARLTVNIGGDSNEMFQGSDGGGPRFGGHHHSHSTARSAFSFGGGHGTKSIRSKTGGSAAAEEKEEEDKKDFLPLLKDVMREGAKSNHSGSEKHKGATVSATNSNNKKTNGKFFLLQFVQMYHQYCRSVVASGGDLHLEVHTKHKMHSPQDIKERAGIAEYLVDESGLIDSVNFNGDNHANNTLLKKCITKATRHFALRGEQAVMEHRLRLIRFKMDMGYNHSASSCGSEESNEEEEEGEDPTAAPAASSQMAELPWDVCRVIATFTHNAIPLHSGRIKNFVLMRGHKDYQQEEEEGGSDEETKRV